MWKKLDTSESRSTSFPRTIRNLKNNNDERMVDTESMTYSPRRTPSLTMALLKLHDVFDYFCNHIQDATCKNAQAACLIFDSSIAASNPNSPSISGSPSSKRSSSPSRSPTITSWFVGSYNSESGSSQKSEWSTLVNPLIICKIRRIFVFAKLYCMKSHYIYSPHSPHTFLFCLKLLDWKRTIRLVLI